MKFFWFLSKKIRLRNTLFLDFSCVLKIKPLLLQHQTRAIWCKYRHLINAIWCRFSHLINVIWCKTRYETQDLQRVTSKHNICPIEVKSTQRYTTSSLDKFREKFKAYLHTSFIVHSGDLKVENGICYLPLYMAPLL